MGNKTKEKIGTHVIMPGGALNDRAAEAAYINADGRVGYPEAVFPVIISENQFVEEIRPARKQAKKQLNLVLA